MTAAHPHRHPHRHQASWRVAMVALAAVGFAVSVFQIANNSSSKGFVTFLGQQVRVVDPEGPAEAMGILLGDRIVAIDQVPVASTLDYVDRLLSRPAGQQVDIQFERPGDPTARAASIRLTGSSAWLAFLGILVSAGFASLGLLALVYRSDERSSWKFFQVSVVFPLFFVGAISWTQLLLHPILAIVASGGLCFYGPAALDLALSFSPRHARRPRQLLRGCYVAAGLLFVAIIGAVSLAAWDLTHDVPSDRGLRAVLVLLALGHLVSVAALGASLIVAYRQMRRASGTERAQLLWLLIGFGLATLPSFAALPFAVSDLSAFLLGGYRPFLLVAGAMWFLATSLAVLQVRLAEIDQIIYRSLAYAMVSSSVLLVYVGVVFAVGYLTQSAMSRALFVPHAAAALSSVLLFRPLHERMLRWLDRRFFRDRAHYLQALRQLSETIMEIREPAQLAQDLVEQLTPALRASSGALYLFVEGAGARLAHSVGAAYSEEAEQEGLPLATGGISVALSHEGKQEGALLFGPRLDGNLYSTEDRDLLVALAGQLATALVNAQSFGTIAELSRTLELQNKKIGELKGRLEDENRYLKARLAAGSQADRLVGDSKVVQELQQLMAKGAASEANVLLLGPSGTGKGLVARTLHRSSERASASLIHVDCGAIPAAIFESELFGHERGAFTGAHRLRRGHFELAQGGVLFLDEIGELPLELQPKLLRVLQERSFVRVGGSNEISADVRIIAATNRNLEEMVSAKTFREDLYYRLRVLEITVPSLRERKEDMTQLVDCLLPKLSRRNRRRVPAISSKAIKKLQGYGWPGNIRELQNVLEQAIVLCESNTIEADDIALPKRGAVAPLIAVAPGTGDHAQDMRKVEKEKLSLILEQAEGNKSVAARALGMPRSTFVNKLRRHDLL